MVGPSDCLPDWLSPILDNLDPDGKIRAALDAPRGPAPTVAAGDLDRFTPDERIRRARGWLARVPAAVQGQNGSGATYAAACGVVHGFAVDPDAALDLLLAEYNPKCLPPWSARELGHKVDDATRKQHAEPVGYLLLRGSDDPAEVEAVAALLRSPARPAPPPRPVGHRRTARRRRPTTATGATSSSMTTTPIASPAGSSPATASRTVGRWPTGGASSTSGAARGGSRRIATPGRRPLTRRPAGISRRFTGSIKSYIRPGQSTTSQRWGG
jgi:hypothetical protein